MKHTLHSHCGGNKILPIVLQKEIATAIAAIVIKPAVGAAAKMREAFLVNLKGSGWSSEVSVSPDSDMTITSLKNGVGLCLQTGNMARIYADLIKLQAMYLDNSIKSAAIILPSHDLAKQLGSNIAQAKRLERELEIFKKAYHVPTLVFSIE